MKGSKLKARDRWIDVLVFLVVILVLFPIVWTFLTSIKGRFDISAMPPKLLFTPTIENYRKVFIEDGFYRYFKDSIIIALIATVIAIFLGTMTAYGLVRYRVGGKFLPFWILSTRMLPPIAIILPIYILMQRIKLIDTYASIIIMHVLLNLPFAVWLMSWGIHSCSFSGSDSWGIGNHGFLFNHVLERILICFNSFWKECQNPSSCCRILCDRPGHPLGTNGSGSSYCFYPNYYFHFFNSKAFGKGALLWGNQIKRILSKYFEESRRIEFCG